MFLVVFFRFRLISGFSTSVCEICDGEHPTARNGGGAERFAGLSSFRASFGTSLSRLSSGESGSEVFTGSCLQLENGFCHALC